jgi:hypothetical protein
MATTLVLNEREMTTPIANHDSSGAHSQAEMLKAIAPYKRSTSWLKEVRTLWKQRWKSAQATYCNG